MTDSFETWKSAFGVSVACKETAIALKSASLDGRLADWTATLTSTVIAASESCGWNCAALGHRSTRLPQPRNEYLSLDVTAFTNDDSARKWPQPCAVFELENAKNRVLYSLWKVLCVNTRLRVVFGYQRTWDGVRDLVRLLESDVIGSLSATEIMALTGETVVIMGSRGEGETFPWGYFRYWILNRNLGRFEKA